MVPMRDYNNQLVGVELINEQGDKQTYGHKGFCILGNPEDAEVIHITEGWATLWACAQLRPKRFGGIVCFGKGRLDEAAEFADATYNADVIPHYESGKEDVWDYWAAGMGEDYMRNWGI